jgi:hypothetical protein
VKRPDPLSGLSLFPRPFTDNFAARQQGEWLPHLSIDQSQEEAEAFLSLT